MNPGDIWVMDGRQWRVVASGVVLARSTNPKKPDFQYNAVRVELIGPAPATAPQPPTRNGVRDTSRDAYDAHKASGKVTKQQLRILQAMRDHGAADYTRQEISRLTYPKKKGDPPAVPINAVCGRVDELLDPIIGLLVETRRRRCGVTGENAMALRLVEGAKF